MAMCIAGAGALTARPLILHWRFRGSALSKWQSEALLDRVVSVASREPRVWCPMVSRRALFAALSAGVGETIAAIVSILPTRWISGGFQSNGRSSLLLNSSAQD
jgi:hypothetical protein